MSVSTYTLGPGILKIGTGALQVAGQIENCRVDWSENVTSSDDRKFLDGSTLAGRDKPATHKAVLAGRAVQDLSAGGFTRYTWANAGTETPFEFTPNTAVGVKITGSCYPVPMTIGGDVGTEGPTSDFSWRCQGKPTFA